MMWFAGLATFLGSFTLITVAQAHRSDPVRRRLAARRRLGSATVVRLRTAFDSFVAPHLERAGLEAERAQAITFASATAGIGLGLTGVVAGLVGQGQLGVVLLLLGVLVLFAPLAWLRLRTMDRLARIERHLPLLAESLAVGLEAGSTLEMSLTRMAPRLSGPLGEEVRRTLGELRLGATRREALWGMARRVDLPELTSLVMTVVQSEEFGAGLASVIRTLARQMRARQMQRAEKSASQAPVKLLFPLIFFIFPGLLVLLLGPLFLGKGLR